MKRILLICILQVCIKTSYSQNTWTQKSNYGGSNRTFTAQFTIGDKGYVGTGNSGIPNDFRADFWEFDGATNAWTQKANFGGGAREGASGFSIGNKGYI